MIFNVIILRFNLIIKDSLMLKDVENCGIQRKSCIQRHSKFFAFSRNPAFRGKGFLPFTAGRKIWHSVKIRKRIPYGFHSAEILAFRGNPQTIPFIFKNLKIFGIQRKLRGQGKWLRLVGSYKLKHYPITVSFVYL